MRGAKPHWRFVSKELLAPGKVVDIKRSKSGVECVVRGAAAGGGAVEKTALPQLQALLRSGSGGG